MSVVKKSRETDAATKILPKQTFEHCNFADFYFNAKLIF